MHKASELVQLSTEIVERLSVIAPDTAWIILCQGTSDDGKFGTIVTHNMSGDADVRSALMSLIKQLNTPQQPTAGDN